MVELLITLALMIILMVMYGSAGSKSFQQKQKEACRKNLQHIFVALQTFTADNNQALPLKPDAATSEPVLSLLVPRYSSATAIFICPGSKGKALPEAESFADKTISYSYYMGIPMAAPAEQPIGSDAQINARLKSKGDPVFSRDGKKPGSNHHKYGGNFLFRDGRTEGSKPALSLEVTNLPGVILLNPRS